MLTRSSLKALGRYTMPSDLARDRGGYPLSPNCARALKGTWRDSRMSRLGHGRRKSMRPTLSPLLIQEHSKPRRGGTHTSCQLRTHAAQQDASYSITSSAVASNCGGTVRPSIVAVWELMTSSNLLDCTTGKSAGLAPLRMRPTYEPA